MQAAYSAHEGPSCQYNSETK